jgi:CRISPR-associated protein Csm3
MDTLIKKIQIEGTLKLKTGLHIGGTNSAMGIGGPDSFLIRNPLDNKPIIPGSSLKGKMRSLLELAEGKMEKQSNQIQHGPTQGKNIITNLYGNSSNDENQHPSRLIVRDCELLTEEDKFQNSDLPFSETKTEVVIDRITAKATPRQIERVPAGAEFSLNMTLNVHDTDHEDSLVNTMLRSLGLVADDYLGGSGSRGYGQIEINIEDMKSRSMAYYRGEEQEKSILESYREQVNRLNA